MKIDTTIHIDTPMMPNFLTGRCGVSIDDAYDTIKIDIAQLTQQGVDQYLEAYCKAFTEHWKKRREVKE